MIEKRAYSIQMNFDVPDSEKMVAEKAEEYFDSLKSMMEDLSNYLDLIYIPFQKRQNLDMNMVLKYEKTFRQYNEEVQKKFAKIMDRANRSVASMSEFSTDTATSELINSFMDSIKELEKYSDTFVSIFQNLNNPEFRNHLVSTIESIKKQLGQIRQLISDRILDHIDNNILAKEKNWLNTSEKPMKERVPLVIQLFKERQRALKESPQS